MKIIIDALFSHSKAKTLNQFSDWIKERTGVKIQEGTLSRWLNEKHSMSPVYKNIFNNLLKKEL